MQILRTLQAPYQSWSGELRGLTIYSKQLTSVEVARHYADSTAANSIEHPDSDAVVARYLFTERTGGQMRSDVQPAPTLEIPANFNVPHKRMLASAVEEFESTRSYLNDVLQNIAGFVPLGMILCVYFCFTRSRAQSLLYATLVGGFLSFTIEFLQFYIPRRNSGTTDIITNTLGAVIGAALVRPDWVREILRAVRLLPSPKSPGSPQN